MKNLKISIFALFAIVSVSCSSDDNTSAPVNEEEVITTITMTLSPQIAGTPVSFSYRDLDGDGPNAPVIVATGNLSANTVYDGSLELLNETTSPSESITEEILEEAEDHQFFFSATNNIANMAYAAPFDANSQPVGVNFTLTTSTAASGNLTFVLRHQPNKSAAGVAAGDIANAGGDTDLQVTFPVTVQ